MTSRIVGYPPVDIMWQDNEKSKYTFVIVFASLASGEKAHIPINIPTKRKCIYCNSGYDTGNS